MTSFASRGFRISCFILSFFLILISWNTAFTQNKNRLALVIGNAAYQHGGVLKNPVNDVNLMATTLNQLGFDVIKETDAGLKSMQMAFKKFANQMSNYEVVLFFYAGHGMQIDGQNYLIPVDAQLEDKMSIEFEAFKVSSVNRYFATNSQNLNIMILDACRNNPYRSWARGGENGFKAIGEQGAGTIIAFATREGETASDGTGDNGLFTQHLVAQMKIPQNITEVFQNTRVTVLNASNKQQVPQEWNMLTGNFYFTEKAEVKEEVTLGNAVSSLTYGNISLTTAFEGDLYLDGKIIGTVGANTKVPINNVTAGKHTLEIGTWSRSIVVEENNTLSIKVKIKEENANQVFNIVDEPAKPINGMADFYKFINKEMKYPKEAKKLKVDGNVYTSFIVEKDGSISDVNAMSGIELGCPEEAIRLLKLYPKWKPGKKDGKIVRTRMHLMVTFRL